MSKHAQMLYVFTLHSQVFTFQVSLLNLFQYYNLTSQLYQLTKNIFMKLNNCIFDALLR